MEDDKFQEEKEKIKEFLKKISNMDESEIREKYSNLERTQEFHDISRMMNPNWKCELSGCWCEKA